MYPAWTTGTSFPVLLFCTNPSTNLWLCAAITASTSAAFAAISAASPVIVPSLFSSAGECVNATYTSMLSKPDLSEEEFDNICRSFAGF